MATVTSSTSKCVCFFLFLKYTSIPNLKRFDQELPPVEPSKENLDFSTVTMATGSKSTSKPVDYFTHSIIHLYTQFQNDQTIISTGRALTAEA